MPKRCVVLGSTYRRRARVCAALLATSFLALDARADSIGDGVRTTGYVGEALFGTLVIVPGAILLGLNADAIRTGFRTDPSTRVAGGIVGATALLAGTGFIALAAPDYRTDVGKSFIGFGAIAAAVGAVDLGLAIAGSLLPPRPTRVPLSVAAVPMPGGAALGLSGRF